MSNVQDTYLGFIRNFHVQALTGYVLPTIQNWIKQNKGIDVTVDDMLNSLKIEPPTQLTVTAPVSSLTPPPASSGSGRKKANVAKPAPVLDPNGGCIYIFTRKAGDKNKGDRCGQPLYNNSSWCKSCIKKTGGGNQKTTAKSPVVSGLTSSPPLTQINGTESKSNPNEIEISIIPIKEVPNFYYEEKTGILVENVNNTYVSYGIYNTLDRSLRLFTEHEQGVAKGYDMPPCSDGNVVSQKLSLVYGKLNFGRSMTFPVASYTVQKAILPFVPSVPVVESSPVQQQAAIPQIPVQQFGSIPTLPIQGNTMSIPTVSALPVAQNGNMGFPTISALPSVNSMQGLPMPAGIQMPVGVGMPQPGFPTFTPIGSVGIPVAK
jgi:hypothetical protein